jgi:hypothetical protein
MALDITDQLIGADCLYVTSKYINPSATICSIPVVVSLMVVDVYCDERYRGEQGIQAPTWVRPTESLHLPYSL